MSSTLHSGMSDFTVLANDNSTCALAQAIELAQKGMLHKAERAVKEFEQLCSFPRDMNIAVDGYMALYNHYCDHSFYSHALDRLNSIIDISAQYGQIDFYAAAVIGMGNICEIYGKPERALKFYGRIRDLEPTLSDPSIILQNNLHILSCNIALNKLRNAKRQLTRCQSLTHHCESPVSFNSILYYQAILSRLEGEKRQALISLSQISHQACYFESIWLFLESRREVANCLIEAQRPELAELIMRQCIKYAQWYGNKNTLRRMFITMSRAHEATSNYTAALEVEKHIHPLEMQIITKIPIGDLGGYCLRRLHRCEIKIKLSLSEQKNAKLLEQAQRHRLDELKKETLLDPLTSLFNRRWLSEELDRQADKMALSVVILDIDHFKFVNDNYSHLTGDNVLRQTSAIIKQQFKPYACCRYGGEEFLVILPEDNSVHVREITERCRIAVEQSPWQHILNQSSITISAGVAVRSNKESLANLLRRADMALYQAKQGGRNQVSVNDEVTAFSET